MGVCTCSIGVHVHVHAVSGKVSDGWLLQAVTWIWITCIHICEGNILLVWRVPVHTCQNVIGCLELHLDGESDGCVIGRETQV